VDGDFFHERLRSLSVSLSFYSERQLNFHYSEVEFYATLPSPVFRMRLGC
jgi:hypothetical protein